MKLILPTLIFATLILGSCAETKPITEEIRELSVELEEPNIVGGEVSIKLYSKNKADTLESSLEYMYYENPTLPYQDTVNKMVKEYISQILSFGEDKGTDAELSVEFMEQALDRFGNAYKEELSLYESEDEYFGGIWQTLTTVSIYEENPEFVEVALGNWEYAGGAHGNGWHESILIDIKTGSELKLEDFFEDIGDLTFIAEDIFRADQEIPDDQTLNDAGFWFDDNVFVLNDNFVFNENSVDFLFNTYEIADYATGALYLTIPMERVKHLLKRKVQF